MSLLDTIKEDAAAAVQGVKNAFKYVRSELKREEESPSGHTWANAMRDAMPLLLTPKAPDTMETAVKAVAGTVTAEPTAPLATPKSEPVVRLGNLR